MAHNPAEIALGPIFIGTILNVLLYGIMITQVYLYFATYKNDRAWMKCLVASLFVADTINAIFDIVFVYESLVLNFGDITRLATANWVFATDPALTGLIAGTVQCFFAWRVKMISSQPWYMIFILVCSFVGTISGIGTAIAVGMVPDFQQFQKFSVIVILWLTSEALADTLIAILLVIHLRRRRTGFAVTDTVINRVIRLSVQSGAITALVAIADLLIFLLDSSGNHLIFNFPLAKLYSNSLMSSLNARGGWKFMSTSEHDQSSHQGATALQHTASRRAPTEVVCPRSTVFVQVVESHELSDNSRKNSHCIGDVFASETDVGTDGSLGLFGFEGLKETQAVLA